MGVGIGGGGMTSPEVREELRRVAVHIVARARVEATGRFGLRVVPNGFGTPEFGAGPTRVRVCSGALWVESTATGAALTRSAALHGSSLRSLADVAGVDLEVDLSVGTDTPPLGDIDAPLITDDTTLAAIADWWTLGARAIDAVVQGCPPESRPTVAQLWPEHFDLGLDVGVGTTRVNLGASAGDSFHQGPYLYVGPWSAERPGDAAYWNAPFGAVMGADRILAADDPLREAIEFMRRGVSLVADFNR